MTKTIPYILICLFLVQCTRPKETTQSDNKTSNTDNCVISIGDKYFDFDELIHYWTSIDETDLTDIMTKDNKTKEEKFINDYVCEDLPKNIKDTSFIKNLEKYGFYSRIIESDRYGAITKIFSERKVRMIEEASCIPEYRDILVFKNHNKIVGIAKVCFTCGQNIIIGTSKNTDAFGQCGDYDELETLLYTMTN